MASLNFRHNVLASYLKVAYTENKRQLVAEGVSPPVEAAAFSASLTFEDTGHVFISINTVTFTCQPDARLADLWMKYSDTPRGGHVANRERQNVSRTPGFLDVRPIRDRPTLGVLHNFADALHVLAAWPTVWESVERWDRQTDRQRTEGRTDGTLALVPHKSLIIFQKS